MKKGLIVLVLAFLLASEYTFVEFYPLSPHARVRKFEKLPGVRQYKRVVLERRVKNALSVSREGSLAVIKDGTRTAWTSAEQLLSDFDNGHTNAGRMIYKIEQAESIAANLSDIRQRARSGDPTAIMSLYKIGKNHTDEIDEGEALEMMKQHPSALARYYLQVVIEKRHELVSREGVLLMARTLVENFIPPALTSEQRTEFIDGSRRRLKQLRFAANNGDEDAVWVLERLLAEGYSIEPAEPVSS